MSIESSIEDAFDLLSRCRYDSAMTLACTALDATATNEFGGSPATRWRAFVNANLDVVTAIMLGGAIRCAPGSSLSIKDPASAGDTARLEDIMYKSIRCYLVHETTLPADVSFTDEAFYGQRDGVFLLPVLTVYALLMAVVVAPSNRNRRLTADVTVNLCGKRIGVNHMWGEPQVLRAALGMNHP